MEEVAGLLRPWERPGIFIAPFEQGEIGPDLFRKACEFGLEGLVSKRRDRPYRPGPVTALDQEQEPKSSRNEQGHGSIQMTTLA